MQKMTTAEYRAFMLSGTRTGKLSTVRADGRPHVVPVWFLLDGDAPVFMTGSGTLKGRNLQREPRVALCVDEEAPPYAFALVEGTAEVLTPTPAELLDWSTRIARRYMGDDRAEAYGQRNAVPEELLIRINPTKIVAFGGVSD